MIAGLLLWPATPHRLPWSTLYQHLPDRTHLDEVLVLRNRASIYPMDLTNVATAYPDPYYHPSCLTHLDEVLVLRSRAFYYPMDLTNDATAYPSCLTHLDEVLVRHVDLLRGVVRQVQAHEALRRHTKHHIQRQGMRGCCTHEPLLCARLLSLVCDQGVTQAGNRHSLTSAPGRHRPASSCQLPPTE